MLAREVSQYVGGEVIAVGRKTFFPTELETDLVNHCVQMVQYFGCSCSDIRHCISAGQDKWYSITNPFSVEK